MNTSRQSRSTKIVAEALCFLTLPSIGGVTLFNTIDMNQLTSALNNPGRVVTEQLPEPAYEYVQDYLVDQGILFIERCSRVYQDESRLLSDAEMTFMHQFFSREFLDDIKIIPVDQIPAPDYCWVRIAQFIEPEKIAKDPIGLCCGDIIFIVPGEADDEEIILHELIHTYQIRALGRENFLRLYFHWGLQEGYEEIPFEKMARQMTIRAKIALDRNNNLDLEAECATALDKIMRSQDLIPWPR